MLSKLLIGISLGFTIFLMSGCASYKEQYIDVKPVDSYLLTAQSAGVSLAADPYDTKEKAEQGFYVDVTEKGYYPIHLIVQNDSDDKILILRDNVEMVDLSGNSLAPVRSTVMSQDLEKNKMAYALLGFGIFSYMSADEANKKMESDWRDKELPEQLIIPQGRKANAFVYFKLKDGQSLKGDKLIVEVEKLSTSERFPLQISL